MAKNRVLIVDSCPGCLGLLAFARPRNMCNIGKKRSSAGSNLKSEVTANPNGAKINCTGSRPIAISTPTTNNPVRLIASQRF
jgi:hypothetical protein